MMDMKGLFLCIHRGCNACASNLRIRHGCGTDRNDVFLSGPRGFQGREARMPLPPDIFQSIKDFLNIGTSPRYLAPGWRNLETGYSLVKANVLYHTDGYAAEGEATAGAVIVEQRENEH
ncbi:MAG: hypothetical protein U1F35_21655 [Steroidobacteraceae bacterium]